MTVPDDAGGKTVTCPGCKKKFMVPLDEQQKALADAERRISDAKIRKARALADAAEREAREAETPLPQRPQVAQQPAQQPILVEQTSKAIKGPWMVAGTVCVLSLLLLCVGQWWAVWPFGISLAACAMFKQKQWWHHG